MLVVTVSPHEYNRAETVNALRFGRRCKLVTNKASVNRVYRNEELMKKLAALEPRVQLQEMLQEMLQQKAYEAFQDSELPKQLEAAQQQVEQVQAKLAALHGENDALDAALQALKTEQIENEDKAAADKERLDAAQAKEREAEEQRAALARQIGSHEEAKERLLREKEVLAGALDEEQTSMQTQPMSSSARRSCSAPRRSSTWTC